MLTEILSRESCANCRVCCVFDRDDCWEMPLIVPELASEITDKYPEVKLLPTGENRRCKIFDVEYDKEGLTRCPMLSETGCRLGERKPFDCRIWPFRVMKKGDCLLLTLSPVCKTVSDLPVSKVSDFAAKVSGRIFEEAEVNPEMIKEYIDGYPAFAVK